MTAEKAQVRLNPRQRDALFVVGQREPVTARDVAYSLLSTDTAERSRLDGLCRRGLLDRQYTGLGRGERVGYVLSRAGREALDALDLDDDYDPTDDEQITPPAETAVERCRRLHGLEPGYVMGCDECELVCSPGRPT